MTTCKHSVRSLILAAALTLLLPPVQATAAISCSMKCCKGNAHAAMRDMPCCRHPKRAKSAPVAQTVQRDRLRPAVAFHVCWNCGCPGNCLCSGFQCQTKKQELPG